MGISVSGFCSSFAWIVCLTASLLLTAFTASNCEAQASTTRLFNGQAAAKADEFRGRRRSSLNSRAGEENSVLQLRPDTVQSIISNSRNSYGDFFGDYRGLNYVSGFQSIFRLIEPDESEEQAVAQRLLFYQTLKTITQQLKDSPLDIYYRRAVAGFKSVGRSTTVQLTRTSKGELNVEQGEAPRQRFIEFKLHASLRDGFEPRVRLGDNLMLRLDPLRGDTLLEFTSDF